MQYPTDPDVHHLRRRFVALCGELCSAMNQPSPARIFADAMVVPVDIDDVAFDLVHDTEVDGGTFLVECVLGPPPRSEEALVSLLQANMQLLRQEQGSLGLRLGDDTVLLTYGVYRSVSETHAAALHEMMKILAQRALVWRAEASF